jgi:galactokinase
VYPASVSEQFYRIYGVQPQIVVRAPGRINLIGEHTDYNEGFVLPAAIDRAIWLAVSPRDDRQIQFHALDLDDAYLGDLSSLQKSPQIWPDYLLGCISECLKDGHEITGVNVVFGGDIPHGAGLSSSAALESGMLFALNEIFGLQLERQALALLAQRAENCFVGAQCGIMDMFASLMGREGCALKLDCRSLVMTPVSLHHADTALLLCDTGVKHQLASTAYNTRRAECEEGVRFLRPLFPEISSLRDVDLAMLEAGKKQLREVVYRRCKFVIEENSRVEKACKLLETNGLSSIGSLLYASHLGLRNQYEVSCPELDFLVDHTPDSLSFFGARMMGGGFGGCTLNVLKQESVPGFTNYLSKKYREKFGRELRCWGVKISNGVERIS